MTISHEYAEELGRQIDELEAENERLREALEECVQTLAMAEHPARVDPQHGAEVAALGDRIGFGALMYSASASWRAALEKDGLAGMEFVSSPCRISVVSALKKARTTLAAQPRVMIETAKQSPDKCGRDCQYYDYFEMLRNWFADEIRRAPRVMITEDTDWCGSFEVTDEQVETACEAYADATNYYVKFHRGLSSPSADHIRKGMRAALSALARPKEK